MMDSIKLKFNIQFMFMKINKEIIANKRIKEANVWVKKYFRVLSLEFKFLLSFIRGIKDNRLISNPIQALSQEFAEILIRVPKKRHKIKIKYDEFLKIKKKRIKTFIDGV